MSLEEFLLRFTVEAGQRTSRVRLRECEGYALAKKVRAARGLDEYELRFRTWCRKIDTVIAERFFDPTDEVTP